MRRKGSTQWFLWNLTFSPSPRKRQIHKDNFISVSVRNCYYAVTREYSKRNDCHLDVAGHNSHYARSSWNWRKKNRFGNTKSQIKYDFSSELMMLLSQFKRDSNELLRLWLPSFLRLAVWFAADLVPIQHSLREIHELWQWAENEVRQNCARVNSIELAGN